MEKPIGRPSTLARRLLLMTVVAQLLPASGLACLEVISAHTHMMGAEVPAHVEAALSSCSAALAVLSILVIMMECCRLVRKHCTPDSDPIDRLELEELKVVCEAEPLCQVTWGAWRQDSSVSESSLHSLTIAMDNMQI